MADCDKWWLWDFQNESWIRMSLKIRRISDLQKIDGIRQHSDSDSNCVTSILQTTPIVKDYVHWSVRCQPTAVSALSRWSTWTQARGRHCPECRPRWRYRRHRQWWSLAALSAPATQCRSCCASLPDAGLSRRTCTCSARCAGGSVICTAKPSWSSSKHAPVTNTPAFQCC